MKRFFILASIALIFQMSAAAGTLTDHLVFAYSDQFSPNTSLVLTTASGATITEYAIWKGHYIQSGSGWYGNYAVGLSFNDTVTFNNGFAFYIPNFAGETIVDAKLNIWNETYFSHIPTETYRVFDVTTSIPDLMVDHTGRVDIFNDLGSGILYGSYVASAADDQSYISIDLSPEAIAAITDKQGKNFAIGGALAPAVPEPGTLLLFGTGLTAFGGVLRRRLH